LEKLENQESARRGHGEGPAAEKGQSSVPWVYWYRDPVLLVALSLVFSLDQITKAIVRHKLLLHQSVPSEGPVRITHTFNTGSAFGLFPDQTLLLILASLVGIGVLLVIYRNHPFPNLPLRLSLGMQLGGAVGNLLDRLRMGQVTDFIELGAWPVFNVADASIVIGISMIAYMFLFAGRGGSRAPSPAPSARQVDGEAVSPHSWPLDPGILKRPASSGYGPLPDAGCPICDFPMVEVPDGWRCSGCGVKEWRDGREGPDP
jgi:signal peptidase II